MTNSSNEIIEEVLNSFKCQHNAEDRESSDYTKNLISHLPPLYNRTQRRKMHRTPFTIRGLDEVLYKQKPRKTTGVDGLPAELYRRLPLNLKRRLTAHLWDIAIGRTDIPMDWANLVHPLYKKGNSTNLENWRPIICGTTEAKLIWMLILKGVAPVVYAAIPPTIWGAIPGRSPLEAIFMQDTVVDIDPIRLIIMPLDVKSGLFQHPTLPSARHLGAHETPFWGFLAGIPRHPPVSGTNRCGHYPIDP